MKREQFPGLQTRAEDSLEMLLCVPRVLVGHKPGEPVGRTWVHTFSALAHPEKVLLLLFLLRKLVFEELGSKKKKKKKDTWNQSSREKAKVFKANNAEKHCS